MCVIIIKCRQVAVQFFFFFGKIEEKEQDHFEKENTKAVE